MDINALVTEMKSSLEDFMQRQNKRLDALEVKAGRPPSFSSGTSPLIAELKTIPELERLIGGKTRTGVKFELSPDATADLLFHKNISTAGVGGYVTGGGPVPSARDAGIVAAARPRLRMRDVIPSRPVSEGEVYWVTESTRPTKASPVTEYTGLKPLVEPAFTVNKEPVQTIAVLALASNQILRDWPDLDSFLRGELAALVREEEDLQILSGSGVPPNLNGLTLQAQAFDTTLLTASDGWEYIDIISAALQQIAEDDELDDGSSMFAVLHPGDWWAIRRLRDTVGRYVLGDPQAAVASQLWEARIVDTTHITKGTFLVGSSSPRAAEIRDRMALTVEISTEDSTNFRYNLCTLRAELRTALVCKRPNAFVTGSLSKSPA